MTPLRLLLIEDTPADATLFCDQIQQSMGNEVEIEWKTRLSDALAILESGQHYDQIWLDPGLPDLGQSGVAKALATLKRYVPAGELRLISSTIAPAIAKQAASQDVQVLNKDSLTSRDSQILQIVGDLLAKRSGGYETVKVNQARFEGTIAKLEYQVHEILDRIAKIEGVIERSTTLAFELAAVKEAIGKIPAIEAKLSKSQDAKEIRLGRMDLMAKVTIALISASVALGTVALPKLIDKLDHTPVKPSDPIEAIEAPGIPDAP